MKKVAILARNYTDQPSRRLLTEAGFQILPQPAAELGVSERTIYRKLAEWKNNGKKA